MGHAGLFWAVPDRFWAVLGYFKAFEAVSTFTFNGGQTDYRFDKYGIPSCFVPFQAALWRFRQFQVISGHSTLLQVA
jgi:hypothetical protein